MTSTENWRRKTHAIKTMNVNWFHDNTTRRVPVAAAAAAALRPDMRSIHAQETDSLWHSHDLDDSPNPRCSNPSVQRTKHMNVAGRLHCTCGSQQDKLFRRPVCMILLPRLIVECFGSFCCSGMCRRYRSLVILHEKLGLRRTDRQHADAGVKPARQYGGAGSLPGLLLLVLAV